MLLFIVSRDGSVFGRQTRRCRKQDHITRQYTTVVARLPEYLFSFFLWFFHITDATLAGS